MLQMLKCFYFVNSMGLELCVHIHRMSLFSLNFGTGIGDSLIIITLINLFALGSRWKRVEVVIQHDWSPWFPSQRMFDQTLSYFTAKYIAHMYGSCGFMYMFASSSYFA